jgi:hypothetical protein
MFIDGLYNTNPGLLTCQTTASERRGRSRPASNATQHGKLRQHTYSQFLLDRFVSLQIDCKNGETGRNEEDDIRRIVIF